MDFNSKILPPKNKDLDVKEWPKIKAKNDWKSKQRMTGNQSKEWLEIKARMTENQS